LIARFSIPPTALGTFQDFAKAGADMYTFHIESVVPDTSTLSATDAHPEVSELCGLVRAANMHVGITLKPETPVEVLFPYVEAGLVDMVGKQSVSRDPFCCVCHKALMPCSRPV